MTLHHLASKWLKVNFICEMCSTNSYMIVICEAPNLGQFLRTLQPRIHGDYSIQCFPSMSSVSSHCISEQHKEMRILQSWQVWAIA